MRTATLKKQKKQKKWQEYSLVKVGNASLFWRQAFLTTPERSKQFEKDSMEVIKLTRRELSWHPIFSASRSGNDNVRMRQGGS